MGLRPPEETFTPVANANGAAYASFTFQVQDDGGTANGGVDLDASARTMTVNCTAVNDAPVGTSQTVTTLEDTVYTFTAADFGFTSRKCAAKAAITSCPSPVFVRLKSRSSASVRSSSVICV